MLVLFLFVVSAGAEIKIAVVNLQKALDESTAGKKAVEEMRDLFGAKQKTIENKRAELKQMQQELNNQSSLLTEQAKKDKLEVYQQDMKELQRYIQDSNDEMKKRENEYISRIARELRNVVMRIGKELNYDLIIEAQEAGVLYHSNVIDMTVSVIDRYNSEWNARKK
jgi:outer membrane protein